MSKSFLPFSKPSIDEATIKEMEDCLRSGWLATGPRTKRFEEALRDYFRGGEVICVSSGTAALHLSLLALRLQPGDEVITTPLTFVATLNTIVQAGGKPVLVDIAPNTFNIDVNRLEETITPRTRAILPVHFTGVPADLDVIYQLAEKHHLRVIEDAAQAIGAKYKNKLIGSFGDTHIFSFHPNKNLTSGEGGCIVTFDQKLAKQAKIMRFHGIDRDSFNRFSKEGSQHYDVVQAGFKYNMMDIQAAIGLHQLPRLENFIYERTKLAEAYLEILHDWPQFTLPQAPHFEHRHNWHLFTPLINPEVAGMERDTFLQKMKDLDIGLGLHYDPVHLYSFYRTRYGFEPGDFPIAENVCSRIMSLPLFPEMTVAEQDRVVEAMIKILRSN